jgi:hypothetical protein
VRWLTNSGFDIVIACLDGEPAGQTWGWPLTEQKGANWWAGLSAEPEPGFTREDDHRTFALSEIMVREAYTGQGIARSDVSRFNHALRGTR